jgi:hypothetical protein
MRCRPYFRQIRYYRGGSELLSQLAGAPLAAVYGGRIAALSLRFPKHG